MKKISTVLVVMTVLLAGCTIGGFGETPTADGTTQEPLDASSVPGVKGTAVYNSSALYDNFTEAAFTGYSDFSFSAKQQSSTFTLRYRNDTQQQLYEVGNSNVTGNATYYVDGESAAIRNASTGEIRYRSQDSRLASQARFTLFVPGLYTSVIEILEWEVTATETVDGERHYVLESDSINETNAAESDWTLSPNESTVEGRLVVGSDGVIHDGQFDIEGLEDSATVTFSLSTDDSIDVTAPDWYDESRAN
jgi:hypothetical protein